MKTSSNPQPPLAGYNLREGFSALQPEVLLASQDRPKQNIFFRSEWLLLWALLEDALHVLTTFHPDRPGLSAKEKRQFETDLQWVQGDEQGAFTFSFVCDHLGLDRKVIRAHIDRLLEPHGRSLKQKTIQL